MGSPGAGEGLAMYGDCAGLSANGLGILNSTGQPAAGPCSHLANSPWTDSTGTSAVCSWPTAVCPLGERKN